MLPALRLEANSISADDAVPDAFAPFAEAPADDATVDPFVVPSDPPSDPAAEAPTITTPVITEQGAGAFAAFVPQAVGHGLQLLACAGAAVTYPWGLGGPSASNLRAGNIRNRHASASGSAGSRAASSSANPKARPP